MTPSARALAAACVLVLSSPFGVAAYLKLGTDVGDRLVPLRWERLPIAYFVTSRDVPGVSAVDARGALARAFDTWQQVPGPGLTSEFVGFTSRDPISGDGMSVVGFRPRPELDRTLASTSFTVDDVTGEILEADIFVNSAFAWSVAPAGEPGRFDVESILVHELGHLLGLGHSGLGETDVTEPGRRRVLGKRAVMFPIAYPPGNIADRSLQQDDRAGLSDVYGGVSFRRETGSISGRVTLNGAGVFGAHVVAFSPETGEFVSTFSLSETGAFVLGGLAPGIYVIRAEPLDDAELGAFFDDDSRVELGFSAAYYARLVAVPAGGSGGDIEIRVPPR